MFVYTLNCNLPALLISVGPCPQILVDIYSQLRAGGDSLELTSLTTYLAFLRNATMHTVDRLHALVESNSESLLLVLGSLAEFAPEDVSSYIFTIIVIMLNSTRVVHAIVCMQHNIHTSDICSMFTPEQLSMCPLLNN